MKVNILFNLKDGPTGGGNQFLKALKRYFQSTSVYEENAQKADMILFNSHQHIDKVAKARQKFTDKLFVHRIDGPMRLYNRMSDKRDDIVLIANKYLADATVFQSDWSIQQNHNLGLPTKEYETVIPNAPDPSLFNRNRKRTTPLDKRKIRLVATSWSANWNKGFKTYQWLDENLNLRKYEMTFIGESPVEFKNIRHIRASDNKSIAEKLKESDIFIFASPLEACSNSLLEALHCGLPTIGANGSSNPELIGRGGETFTNPQEIPDLLEKTAKNYHKYQANIRNPSMEEVGKRYYDFICRVRHQLKPGRGKIQSFRWLDYIRIRALVLLWKLSGRAGSIIEKFKAFN